MRIGSIAIVALVLAVADCALVWMAHAPGHLPPTALPAPSNATTQIINRGEYLARAGDCVACHTAPDGKPFAGGRAMPTPFGNLYVPNITPDDETGIGQMDRRRVLPNDAHGRLARRHAAVSGDAVRVVHEGDARRLRRDLRVPDVGAAGAARRTGRTSCASRSTSASC